MRNPLLSNLHRNVFLLLILFLLSLTTYAQPIRTFIGKKVSTARNSITNQYFAKSTAVELDVAAINAFVRPSNARRSNNNGTSVIRLKMGNYDWTFDVQPAKVTYPNPTNDFVNLDYVVTSEAPISIDLYHLNGQKVKALLPTQAGTIGQYRTSVDLSEIEAGMYFVLWQQGTQIMTKKLAITH